MHREEKTRITKYLMSDVHTSEDTRESLEYMEMSLHSADMM